MLLIVRLKIKTLILYTSDLTKLVYYWEIRFNKVRCGLGFIGTITDAQGGTFKFKPARTPLYGGGGGTGRGWVYNSKIF